MENDQEAAALRRRGAALLRLSLEILVSPAATLVFRAGPDTWVGPTPTRCQDELNRLRTELLRASDDLGREARRLFTQADLVEAHTAGTSVLIR